jgi:hypothetical protein
MQRVIIGVHECRWWQVEMGFGVLARRCPPVPISSQPMAAHCWEGVAATRKEHGDATYDHFPPKLVTSILLECWYRGKKKLWIKLRTYATLVRRVVYQTFKRRQEVPCCVG